MKNIPGLRGWGRSLQAKAEVYFRNVLFVSSEVGLSQGDVTFFKGLGGGQRTASVPDFDKLPGKAGLHQKLGDTLAFSVSAERPVRSRARQQVHLRIGTAA